MKKKLLITGASGFLGYHLLRVLESDWELYGISFAHNFTFNGAVSVKCDITNYIELGNCFDDIEPDALIHAAAISDAGFCQKNPSISLAVNVEASKNLAGICSDFQIPFCFTSTDLVFDGKKGLYNENDVKNPVSKYGEHKALAEEEILKIYPGAAIFRLPLLLGIPDASANNYMQRFLTAIQNSTSITLFTDEYRSACCAKSINMGIGALLQKAEGIIHLGGPERLSRYEIGLKICTAFNLPTVGIHSGLQAEFKADAPRPADVSMDISMARAMGYSPLTLDEELKLIAENRYI
jgi:dTDP-4-dehydrorhamnose reductase